MRKWIKTILPVIALALIVMVPGISAKAGTIKNVNVEIAGENEKFLAINGESDSNVLAVAATVYDSKGKLIKMYTSGTDGKGYWIESSLSLYSDGEYTVKVADYEGGSYNSLTFEIKDGTLKTDEGEDKPGDDTEKPDDSKPGDDTDKPDDSKPGDDTNKPDDSKPGDDTDKPDDSKPGDDTEKPDDSKPGDDINKPDDNTNKDDGTTSTDKIVIIESKNEIATTVSGKVIKSTMKIEQEEIAKTSDTYKKATSAIEKNGDKNLKEASYVKIYEINLLDGSTQVHDVGGVVEVSFKVPADLVVANDEKVVIYRVNNDGSLTKCNTKVVDGIITFETNHFSTYILAKEKAETVNTPTGNTTNNTVTNNTPANNTVTKNPVASAVTTAIKTGDTDKLILWIVLMLIGIAVLTTSIYNVRKAGHHKVKKN